MAFADYAINPASISMNLRYGVAASHGDAFDSGLLVPRQQADGTIADMTDAASISVQCAGPLNNMNTSKYNVTIPATLGTHDATGFEFTLSLGNAEGFCAAAITAGVLAGNMTITCSDGAHTCIIASGTWSVTVLP